MAYILSKLAATINAKQESIKTSSMAEYEKIKGPRVRHFLKTCFCLTDNVHLLSFVRNIMVFR